MTPLSVPGQTVVDARLAVRPVATTFRYWDYWGTLVDAFDVHVPHEELTVTASALVEATENEDCATPVSWSELCQAHQLDRWSELLSPSRYVPRDDEIAAEAATLQAGADPLEAAYAATGWVSDHMTYSPGSTNVATAAPEAYQARHGVCQDFAHVLLGLLRAMGIPSRYASGYLYPDPEGNVGHTVAGQSHAWVEAWVGDWIALDPTNGSFAGERHVLVARGRDYADVVPLKGVYSGAPAKHLDVSVELTRVA